MKDQFENFSDLENYWKNQKKIGKRFMIKTANECLMLDVHYPKSLEKFQLNYLKEQAILSYQEYSKKNKVWVEKYAFNINHLFLGLKKSKILFEFIRSFFIE